MHPENFFCILISSTTGAINKPHQKEEMDIDCRSKGNLYSLLNQSASNSVNILIPGHLIDCK